MGSTFQLLSGEVVVLELKIKVIDLFASGLVFLQMQIGEIWML